MKYSYEQVVYQIENTKRFGNHTGYEVSGHMLEQLGNPQNGIPFVHIAGTNGKGSTTAFLCSILQESGKKVGMFTSPHLVTFRERIRINGVYISEEDTTRLGNLLLKMEFAIPPTMFDYCLAMAVLYFKEQQCDIMVIETGIGGRYDSTNALGVPEAAVITKIGRDHMAVLGNTLEEIAKEKAGIIKKGCPVVVSMQTPSVKKVLLECFQAVNGSDTVFYEVSEAHLQYAQRIPMRMLGGFQKENAAAAILTARVLFAKMQREEKEVEAWIRDGISKTFWKGRMELINTSPFFLIDGAHNAHGVCALAESLQELYPGEKFHFIMAVMADKDYEDMIEKLLPLAMDFTTVTVESARALQSEALAACIRKRGITAVYAEDMEAVIRPLLPQTEKAHCMEGNGEKTIAFGSLYFIGAIEAMLAEKQ